MLALDFVVGSGVALDLPLPAFLLAQALGICFFVEGALRQLRLREYVFQNLFVGQEVGAFCWEIIVVGSWQWIMGR